MQTEWLKLDEREYIWDNGKLEWTPSIERALLKQVEFAL